MKRHRTPCSKTGATAGGASAKKAFKSQNQRGPSSTKKGTSEEGRKQDPNRKQVTQTVKRKAKEHEDYSPAGQKGSSKKIKVTSAKTASWQTLPESSRHFLETVLDSVMLSVLCQRNERKDAIQKHLNLLKERVLRVFKTLNVPPGKLGNLKNLLSLHMAEKTMLEANEESLVKLQEEIIEAERSAERTEETIQQLQYKIQVLKDELEEDEKKARKVYQEDGSGALHLPELPKHSLQAPILQVSMENIFRDTLAMRRKEELLKTENQKGLLKDMNTIQQSADLKNMLTLIEKIYEKVDFL